MTPSACPPESRRLHHLAERYQGVLLPADESSLWGMSSPARQVAKLLLPLREGLRSAGHKALSKAGGGGCVCVTEAAQL